MDMQFVCKEIEQEIVETQADDSDDGKDEEFGPFVLQGRFPENPAGAQEVIDDETCEEGNRRGDKVMKSKDLRQKDQETIIDEKGKPANEEIAEQLDEPVVRFFNKGLLYQFVEHFDRLF